MLATRFMRNDKNFMVYLWGVRRRHKLRYVSCRFVPFRLFFRPGFLSCRRRGIKNIISWQRLQLCDKMPTSMNSLFIIMMGLLFIICALALSLYAGNRGVERHLWKYCTYAVCARLEHQLNFPLAPKTEKLAPKRKQTARRRGRQLRWQQNLIRSGKAAGKWSHECGSCDVSERDGA